MVIENRAGAGGGIAANAVARAAPDGYTILLATGSSLAINVSLYKNLGYDPEKDFEPISLVGTQTNLLYTHPGSVPAKTLAEFVAYVKANPGKLTFGSGGIGTPAHLAGELLKVEAGIEMTHAPFRGTGQALQSVIGGHVPVAFNPPSPLLPHLESGALRAIAVTTLQRTPALPNVPTIAESGYPGFDAATWHAIVAPPGLPKDVLAALHKALHETLNDAATKKALTDLGVDLVNSSPEQLRAYIKSEIPKWAKVVKASGAKVGIGRSMSMKPIEYRDASPEVRAVFDDIKTSRNVAGRQQFLEIPGARSGDAQAHLGQRQRGDGAGRARSADQGNDLSGGQRQQWLRLLHRQPHRGRAQGRHDRRHVRRGDGGDRHGERNQSPGQRLSGADRSGVRALDAQSDTPAKRPGCRKLKTLRLLVAA